MKKLFIALLLSAIVPLAAAHNKTVVTKGQELENCLTTYWGTDTRTAAYIRERMRPLVDDATSHEIIDDFINKSKQLNIDFPASKEVSPLHDEDAIIRSPKQHLVVFESPWVRILWGSTQPRERENLHIHAWKSLLVIVKPTTFEVIYEDGTIEVGDWPIGVYELPAMEKYSCINIGSTADECLRFEVK